MFVLGHHVFTGWCLYWVIMGLLVDVCIGSIIMGLLVNVCIGSSFCLPVGVCIHHDDTSIWHCVIMSLIDGVCIRSSWVYWFVLGHIIGLLVDVCIG